MRNHLTIAVLLGLVLGLLLAPVARSIAGSGVTTCTHHFHDRPCVTLPNGPRACSCLADDRQGTGWLSWPGPDDPYCAAVANLGVGLQIDPATGIVYGTTSDGAVWALPVAAVPQATAALPNTWQLPGLPLPVPATAPALVDSTRLAPVDDSATPIAASSTATSSSISVSPSPSPMPVTVSTDGGI